MDSLVSQIGTVSICSSRFSSSSCSVMKESAKNSMDVSMDEQSETSNSTCTSFSLKNTNSSSSSSHCGHNGVGGAGLENSDRYVYVRSEKDAWIPATLLSMEGNTATVAVKNFKQKGDEEEYFSNLCRSRPDEEEPQIQLVDLQQYENQVFPEQNVDENGNFCEYDDMVNLPHLHEAAILYNLRYRHYTGKPYTRAGEVVVAVNPYKWIHDLYSLDRRHWYTKKIILDDSPTSYTARQSVQPHIYEISALSFREMAFENKNQSILVSGESGAGKTESVKLCLGHIASIQCSSRPIVTKPGRNPQRQLSYDRKKSAMVQRILDSNELLEAFGNAKTRNNDNSSRFGKFIQLQFDRNCEPDIKMVGNHCDVYLLEKNRVVRHDSEERTFHIFYQLLAAPEKEKKAIWRGLANKKPDSYRYVGYTDTNSIEGITDQDRFHQTRQSLEIIGIQGVRFRVLMQALCIVLQLGEIIFVKDEEDDDKCRITSLGKLDDAAKLMGIQLEQLARALTSRTMKAKDESYEVPLTAVAAKESCNSLAKEIYGRVFLWIVDAINKVTRAAMEMGDDNHENTKQFATIGLLDIFGFESYDVNRFDQLCVNYANEKIQHRFTRDVFEAVKLEYEKEEIPIEEIVYDDNTEVLDLIEGSKGLLAMLNEECVRPQGSASGFVFKALKQNETFTRLYEDNHSRLNFGIRHYARDVMYSADEFVTSNWDTLPSNLVQVAGAFRNNSIIAEAFKSDNTTTMDTANSKKLIGRTVWTKYRYQLTTLMTSLSQTQTRYIRCIKPNSTKQPVIMENNIAMEQLRSAGIIAGVTFSRAAFPNCLPNTVICNKFSMMWGQTWTLGDNLRDYCSSLLTHIWKQKETVVEVKTSFCVGKTKTYFKKGALEYLEDERQKRFHTMAHIIQRLMRYCVLQKRLRRAIEGYYVEKARQEEERRVNAMARIIQKFIRYCVIQKRLQRAIRVYLAEKAILEAEQRERELQQRLNRMARVIQRFVRYCVIQNRLQRAIGAYLAQKARLEAEERERERQQRLNRMAQIIQRFVRYCVMQKRLQRAIQVYLAEKARLEAEERERERQQRLNRMARIIQRFSRYCVIQKRLQRAIQVYLAEKARLKAEQLEREIRLEEQRKAEEHEFQERIRLLKKKMNRIQEEVDEIHKKHAEAEEEKVAAIQLAKKRVNDAKKQQRVLREKIVLGDADILKKKLEIQEQVAEVQAKLEVNEQYIISLKQQTKETQKRFGKMKKEFKKESTTNKTLVERMEMQASLVTNNRRASAINVNLREELVEKKSEHHFLYTEKIKTGEEYEDVATERARLQDNLSIMVAWVQEKIDDYDLLTDVQDIAHSAESEQHIRRSVLQVEFPDIVE